MEKEVRWVFAAMIVIAVPILCGYFAFPTGTNPDICSVQHMQRVLSRDE
ncbi:hypothetical protein [uncultured Methanoregula sp.]|nr:hypothetical protein [uncultured Methanoregula sp.]